MSAALGLLYVFLYGPIGYVIYTSFAVDIVWPFPPSFTLQAYADLFSSSLYSEALVNSLMLATGAAIISTFLAGAGAIGILRFRSRYRKAALVIFIAPLFVADLLIGISVLAFNARVLGLPGNLFSAMAANAIQGTAFGFLIILAQLVRYNWDMDDAAMVFGAKPLRCFFEITLPTIWPSLFGALPDQLHPGLQQSRNLVLHPRRHPDLALGRLGLPALRPRAGAVRFGGAGERLRLHGLRRDVSPDALWNRPVRLSRRLTRGRSGD